MRLYGLVLACSTVAFSQSFEASMNFGQSVFPAKSADIGTADTTPNSGTYKMKDGFRVGFRMTINSWRFMGHEFGYAYSRTAIDAPSTTVSTGTVTGLPSQPGATTTTIPAQSI